MGRLIVLLIVAFAVEIAVWIGIAQFISGWWIFLWTAVAFVLGFNLVRGSVGNIMPQLQQMQLSGQMSGDPKVKNSLVKAFAGLLLMLPGVISDLLALLVLLPPVQRNLQGIISKALAKRQQAMMQKMMGGMGMGMPTSGNQGDMMNDLMRRMQEMQGGAGGGSVIDGEARRVEPEVKRIKSANDE